MGQCAIDNETGFAATTLLLADEDGRPLVVPVVRATFSIEPGGLRVASEQLPVFPAGQPNGKPGASSYRHEPEVAFFKPNTDLVLLGHAHAPTPRATSSLVTFQVGSLRKTVQVVGDRMWVRAGGGVAMTRPTPFEKIPLLWERAFGGWDRSNPDPARHCCERRNPTGVGFAGPGARPIDRSPLPNLEDPSDPVRMWGRPVTPVGFGFTSMDWEPRRALAGTFDSRWDSERNPLLPRDFDRRFMNGAAPGLVHPGRLQGGEPVSVTGASPDGAIVFRVPEMDAPLVIVARRGTADVEVRMELDTLVVDADARRVHLTWRGHVRLRRDASEVSKVAVLHQVDPTFVQA